MLVTSGPSIRPARWSYNMFLTSLVFIIPGVCYLIFAHRSYHRCPRAARFTTDLSTDAAARESPIADSHEQ